MRGRPGGPAPRCSRQPQEMSVKVGVLGELPRKPAVAEAPGARVVAHDGACIIADGPLCMCVPFHA